MSPIQLIKTFIADLAAYVASARNLASVRAMFPRSKFYSGAKITSSTFGSSSIIFQDTVIMFSSIGNHSYIQKRSAVLHADVGNFCSIAAGVTIAPGIHYMDGVSCHPSFYLKNTPLLKTFAAQDKISPWKHVTIGHDVWIGQNAVIMDGVNIGTGAIIASGAIVTKDVPPYTIVGGVPAKAIRLRFDEATIQQLLDSAWWEKDDAWLQAHAGLFMSPPAFLAAIKTNT